MPPPGICCRPGKERHQGGAAHRVSDPYATGKTATDANGNVSRYTYDLDDRLANITDAVGRVTSLGYDALSPPAQVGKSYRSPRSRSCSSINLFIPPRIRSRSNPSFSLLSSLKPSSVLSMMFAGLKLGGNERGGNSLNVATN
jgi:YD repeat-containing protein